MNACCHSSWFLCGLLLCASPAGLAGEQPPARAALERSFWLHASLTSVPRGYWGPDHPPCARPTEQDISNAARLLTGDYAANRLYLVYHQECPLEAAEQVFGWWRKHCPATVQLVPTLVLRMYDKQQSSVFAPAELRRFVTFLQATVSAAELAVYDVYPERDQGASLEYLAAQYPAGLIRVGIQPDEKIEPPFVAAVQDTWSGLCHGKSHDDWRAPGCGAESLRNWVALRNEADRGVAWDLIVVAWDYSATPHGAYPGYDDAAKNMPLPAGRNRLAVEEILRTARTDCLRGFSSDLVILQANSQHAARDGALASFYETLKRGEIYQGYYSTPFQEIVRLFHELKTGLHRGAG